MTAVSQWEREAISERTRDAMRHKRANGERVGNLAYGYRLSADGKHLEPEAGEQKALSAIRKLRLRGHTLRGIAQPETPLYCLLRNLLNTSPLIV
jgi:site-specific DNA recombinase